MSKRREFTLKGMTCGRCFNYIPADAIDPDCGHPFCPFQKLDVEDTANKAIDFLHKREVS